MRPHMLMPTPLTLCKTVCKDFFLLKLLLTTCCILLNLDHGLWMTILDLEKTGSPKINLDSRGTDIMKKKMKIASDIKNWLIQSLYMWWSQSTQAHTMACQCWLSNPRAVFLFLYSCAVKSLLIDCQVTLNVLHRKWCWISAYIDKPMFNYMCLWHL